MRPLPRFRNLPVTLRVPLVMAGLMILLGFLASQSVLSALGRVQDARLSETARLHVEGLSVALGPSYRRPSDPRGRSEERMAVTCHCLWLASLLAVVPIQR